MIRCIIISVWLTACCVVAQTTTLERCVESWRAGQRVWNGEAMKTACTQLSEISVQRPDVELVSYWRAVFEFYLLLYYNLEDSAGYDPAQAARQVETVQQTMENKMNDASLEAERLAMLACVYGLRIAEHPATVLWNGPRVLSLQNRALKLDAVNPRVHYLIGAGFQAAPGFFQDLEKAQQHLERAAVLYEEESRCSQPVCAPRWGRAETLGLLGDIMAECGDAAAARCRYKSALIVNPMYTPASRGLAELEKSDGTK